MDVFDFSDTLNGIENRLKGYEYINGKWEKTKPALLEEGSRAFSKIMVVLYAYLGKHIVLSNLTRSYIEVSVSNIYTDLYLDFLKNFLDYGFHSKEDVDVVLDIIVDNLLAAELRAIKGVEMKAYYQGRSESITQHPQAPVRM